MGRAPNVMRIHFLLSLSIPRAQGIAGLGPFNTFVLYFVVFIFGGEEENVDVINVLS